MPSVKGYIERKSMLYVTGVEYGDYTMNHVLGCAHGCKYPCYAFMMKKRFGKVHSYEQWLEPYLVSNTLELLDKEIPKLKGQIKSVQLCFTTDPFMVGYSYYSEGISLIRSTNVYDYFFSFEGLAHINEEQADALSNVIVESYDVLFNITGVSIARCCIVPNSVLPARVNQHVMILRPYAGKYMSYYLMITLCEQSNKNLLLGIGQSGSTREAINKQEMEDFKIPLPDNDAINLFGTKTDACFRQIQNAILQTENLLSIRNTILSRL